MNITAEQLAEALDCPLARAEKWTSALNQAMQRFNITQPRHVAAFLAQIGHESGALARLEENLNYSAIGLSSTWPDRYAELGAGGKPLPGKPNTLALSLHRNRQAIANNVYANRMGNGSEDSGDGWKYRGRGLIQLTGRNNHRECGKALNLPFEDQPELLMQPEMAALSACWYWDSRKLNAAADSDDVSKVTKLINGGLKGLAERKALYAQAKAALGVA